MRIYLHSQDNRPSIGFRAEDLHEHAHTHAHHTGVRGWCERKLEHYKTVWRTSDSAMVRWLRDTWDWLQRRTYADEPMLAHLRAVPTLEIVHAAVLGRDEAERLWQTYLVSRQKRHGIWFAVNALVSPLTVVLAPLPGPNLIGYWFAYRAVHHGLILNGLWKVKAGRVPATFSMATEPVPHCAADDLASATDSASRQKTGTEVGSNA